MLRRNVGGLTLAVLLAAALAACGGVRVPVKQASGPAQTAAACDPNGAGEGRVVVCRGDTLTGIARREQVTVANLKQVNGLRSNRIMAGSVLILPNEYVYVVQPGDTLLDVSRSTGVSTDRLIAANNLTNPDRLLPTSRLAIPQGGTQIAATPETVRRQPAAVATSPQAEELGPPARTPSVTIGRRSQPATAPATVSPDRSPAAQAPASSAPSASTPSASTPSVSTPTVTAPSAPAAPAPETTEETPARTAAMSPDAPASATSAPPQPRPRATPPATTTARTTTPERSAPRSATPAPSASASFILPVEGKIVSDFGPKSGGLHNDGINIAAARGTPIRATADGSVAYAGDGLPGFGNLILIKHEGGWTSAYAHADSMSVKRGDNIRQGQTIGTVGDTGSVSEPQLHFELRQNDRAVDPTGQVR